MKKIFIDGSAGTTGLRIRERLESRRDLEVVILSEELRKDVNARRDALNASDVAFLCLPDAAAVESAALVENSNTVVIDTSTAHRCAEGWTYGFPELAGQRARIAAAKRIANPGCHASGFVALVAPLVEAGAVAADAQLCAFSLTGFSGGGKKMIGAYGEVGIKNDELETGKNSAIPNSSLSLRTSFLGGRQYALGQTHKHLPEMAKYCGLMKKPVFSPVVVPHLSGMEVTVQLGDRESGDLERIREIYREYYRDNGVISFVEDASEAGFISSAALTGRDDMIVSCYGNDERIVLVSLFDNLGKGASGAAIQNMNIALGLDEREGLRVES